MINTEQIQAAFKASLGIDLWPHQIEALELAQEGAALEIATGEGKTAILAGLAAHHALMGRTVHVITANEYLVDRDTEWMRPFYTEMGIDVGKVADYDKSKVLYGTVKQFAQQYLANAVRYVPEPFYPAADVVLIDEADAVLLDNARDAIIVSMPIQPDVKYLRTVREFAHKLDKDADYYLDEDTKVPDLSETGHQKILDLIGIKNLYDTKNAKFMHRLHQALIAKDGMINGKDYVMRGDEVVLIDVSSGREQVGSRLNNGMSQAIEAEEQVAIGVDYITQHRITVGEFITTYKTVTALGGTLWEDKKDFRSLYGLEVKKLERHLANTLTALDAAWHDDKAAQLVEDAIQCKEPVIIVCNYPEDVIKLSAQLPPPRTVAILPGDRNEALKVAGAGHENMITLITPMSARGVDFLDHSGLGYTMLLYDMMETPRMQRQVLGRIARREEPGRYRMYFSINDPIFAGLSARRRKVIQKLSGQGEIHPKIMKAIMERQKRRASILAERRKTVIGMDHLLQPYREHYHEIREHLLLMQGVELEDLTQKLFVRLGEEAKDAEHLYEMLLRIDPELEVQTGDSLAELALEYAGAAMAAYNERETRWHRQMESEAALRILDGLWLDFVGFSEEAADAVGLRTIAKLNPTTEYARELLDAWRELKEGYELSTIRYLLRARLEAHDATGQKVTG